MKVLYIDNRQYGHNSDIHIEFIKFLNSTSHFDIIPVGNYLNPYLPNSIRLPTRKGGRYKDIVDERGAKRKIDHALLKHNPDVILTYNCNGSGYEVGLDNIGLYSWASNIFPKIDVPKIHITTDYCRSGFRKDQADWFSDMKYSLALFRHKESLKHPIGISSNWLPFSINKGLYVRNLDKKLVNKNKKVGFIGAAHNSSMALYAKRISAIDFLRKKNMLKITKVLDKRWTRKMLFGADYVKFLTSNMFNLTCGGTCNFFTAKYIQIPASYSMLVCSDTNGLDMFPRDTYIKFSKDNLDKMYKEISYFQRHPGEAADRIAVLNNYVLREHNHSRRASQLARMIRNAI